MIEMALFRQGVSYWAIAGIHNTNTAAFGASWSKKIAQAKCISETVERAFHFQRQEIEPSFQPVGIAAHISPKKAEKAAWLEVIESYLVEITAKENCFRGIPIFHTKAYQIWATKLNHVWFALCIGSTKHADVATYCASESLFKAIYQAYQEYKVSEQFEPSKEFLETFSKFNYFLKPEELSTIMFEFNRNLTRVNDFDHLQSETIFQKITGSVCAKKCRCDKCGRYITFILKNEVNK